MLWVICVWRFLGTSLKPKPVVKQKQKQEAENSTSPAEWALKHSLQPGAARFPPTALTLMLSILHLHRGGRNRGRGAGRRAVEREEKGKEKKNEEWRGKEERRGG